MTARDPDYIVIVPELFRAVRFLNKVPLMNIPGKFPFDPDAYGPVFAELLREQRLGPLDAGSPNKAVQSTLASLTIDIAFASHTVVDPDMATACLAGVWLSHDYLNESHEISQKVGTSTGSYWHGLMHRREPDFSNAKYWFRQIGKHLVFAGVQDAVSKCVAVSKLDEPATYLVAQASWDPFAFIDLCEACLAGRSANEMLCRKIQQREWEILFNYCFRQAVGM